MVPSIRVNLMKYGKARSWLDSCFHTCVEGREKRERVLSVFGRIKPSSLTLSTLKGLLARNLSMPRAGTRPDCQNCLSPILALGVLQSECYSLEDGAPPFR